MFADWIDEVSGRGIGVLAGLILGTISGWLFGKWNRYQQRQRILRGDARETIVIHHHLVEAVEEPATDGSGLKRTPTNIRVRTLGQGELPRVVPNGHLATELHRRAFRVTQSDTLISMDGAEGSYLLETLTNFVCDRVANAPFEHDLYVMAPCCEPAGLAEHQPITILLISVADLALFESWSVCRNVKVEHSGEGSRILTLMDLSRRFRAEQDEIVRLRQAGRRTRYAETMYLLDLPLDKRSAEIPVKEVPWGRFEDVLKQMNLE